MPLFNEKIVAAALHSFDDAITDDARQAAADWAARAAHESFDLQNESQLEQDFNDAILKRVLGYVPPMTGAPGTMQVKQPIPGGTTVDVALGHFQDGQAGIVAPLELKGPKVALDRIMPGRAKTPVQQAWDYAMDAPGAQWVLVSNMKELRLYAFGHGRQLYEPFDLRKIDQSDELSRLRLLLGADHLLTGATKALLDRSENADREVTNDLYRDYKALRANLMSFVMDQHPAISIEARIRIVQTVLDRLLFIAFAEDKNLLPENSLTTAITAEDIYFPRPKWEQLRKLFEWVDKGAPPHNIPRYNGGLFATDPLIDALALPDHLVEQFKVIADYDFASEVSVTILGHIFEQSITDIENEKAAAGLEAPPPAPKKKREGVVYTPDFITRFIVEQTIGRHLSEIEDQLLPAFGKREPDGTIHWRNKKSAEAEFWTAYLDRLARLRIVDPACGSGAFLIAAFNFLNAEQKRLRDRLSELQPGILTHLSPNADVEIITNNLFGVDVNAESIEITKLALWLQTAKRERALESLDGNIKHGNSVVDSADFHPRPFDWDSVGGEGSFDIVLGNPPYVRMELVKSIKPHLEARFAVATDRADLYAYFFELGVKLLKPGGRLGFISSSTFFRTGSGKLLRGFLAEHGEIESVIDFGDLQVFEGVTTYPAIITLRKSESKGADGSLRYLSVREAPNDLTKTFDDESQPMSRTRLSSDAWRFESDLLDAVRSKIAAGKRTLSEIFGAPLYGIKTGLNDAFVLSRDERDLLIARDPRSAELLKPFLIGENLKRWHAEGDDLWLIYTPKGRVQIDDYPAIRNHLIPWRDRLERRATKQEWWELQQAQAGYVDHFEKGGVLCPDISQGPKFSFVEGPIYPANTIYFLTQMSIEHVGFLNSRLVWFFLFAISNALRGGEWRLRMQTQYLSQIPIPDETMLSLREASSSAHESSTEYFKLRVAVRQRLADVAPGIEGVNAFLDWQTFSFAELQSLLRKRLKASIPISERDEWERWFSDRKVEAAALNSRITEAQAEVDARVYRLFRLTRTEIAAIEDALAIASPALSLGAYEAISAVEGLELSDETRHRLTSRVNDRINV
jgi:type I restriction-modification system DNA methylase subunit